MIAIDTNILVRVAVADDAAQTERAHALIRNAESKGDRVAIAPIVLAELVWALRRPYKKSRAEIAGFLERLLRAPVFHLVDRDMVRSAVTDFSVGTADFADYLIAAYAERESIAETYSFDEDAVATRRFQAVP